MRVAVRVATGTRDSVDAHDFDGTVRHLRLRCHVEHLQQHQHRWVSQRNSATNSASDSEGTCARNVTDTRASLPLRAT